MNNNNKIHLPATSCGFALASLAAAVMTFSSSPAIAGEPISLGDETTLNWSVTTSYGLGMRLSDQDSELLSNINGDDGNRNFDRHSLTSNRVGALAELLLSHKNLGAVLRASAFYDDVYHQSNDNNSPSTINKSGANDEFTGQTKRWSGGYGRFLDAYVYGNFDLPSDQRLSLRLGQHMVAWGEGLFYPGVNGVQSSVDVVKSGQPGVETKEILLPVGQVSANWEVNPDLGISAYYQYEWKGNELNPVGSYLSTSDVTGPGSEYLLLQLAPGFYQQAEYAGTNKPRDSGQYGVRMMYRPTLQWEFGLFHVRYHDRNPAGVTLGGYGLNPISPKLPTTYMVDYFEDINLTGVSFSTLIGDTQVGGEWSYRDNAPINVMTPAGPTPTRGSGQQMQLSFIYTMGAAAWADSTTLLGEIVHVRADDVDADPVWGSTDFTYDQGNNWQTKTSTAYTLQASFSYPGTFAGWDLTVPVSFAQVLDGRTPLQGAISAGEGDKRLAIGATLKRLGNLEFNTTYTNYLSSASLHNNRLLTDRDNITFSAKYTF
ncbi:DUF1302 domain-containing protein [Pseudomonas marincola]|uniref:DUF1302 domain-containing protein n=1 Tax=Pseudomonas marincola TaxID=437900 RepID=UPI0008E3BF04|nr:DUF1302 family protein [Pseudomonas marincola]SFU14039.1 Protein of unknown function [Pseudomonas marincola]